MCLNFGASVTMSVIGFVVSAYVLLKMNALIAFGIFYFTLMEVIQAIGYKVIDQCDNPVNKAIAYLNYAHISFQPFVYTLFIYAILKYHNLTKFSNINIILILAFIASVFLFVRLFGKNKSFTCNLCGPRPCVYSGKHHLRIETPLRTEPEYYTPNVFIHFFFFFVPAIFLGPYGIAIAIFIFVSFTILVKSLNIPAVEGSTTWCFASIAQFIIVLIFAAVFSKKK